MFLGLGVDWQSQAISAVDDLRRVRLLHNRGIEAAGTYIAGCFGHVPCWVDGGTVIHDENRVIHTGLRATWDGNDSVTVYFNRWNETTHGTDKREHS
jgi:hypothetical protein